MNITPLSKDFGAIVHGSSSGELFALAREEIIKLFMERAVLLFTGFNVDLDAFNRFTDRFSNDYMNYRGGGYVRKPVETKNEPKLLSVRYDFGREKQDTFGLPLHGEMYYIDNRPVVVWFYCERPADSDGETTVCDGAQVYRELTAETKKLFHDKRLKYIRKYLDGEWQKIYQTEDIDEAARFAVDNGLEVDLDREQSIIRTEYIHPAVISSRWNHHTVYINNLLPVLWQESMGRETSIVRFEDDTKVPQSVLDEVREIQRKLLIPITWKEHDFVMIDNTRSHHGRRPFRDTEREVFLKMARSVDF